ncbi:MAG: hypothetical protein LUQ22_03670 [Methanotrichaceae archaeon]|nr:hypothetical protein [Methanotrichaceae archaeon]
MCTPKSYDHYPQLPMEPPSYQKTIGWTEMRKITVGMPRLPDRDPPNTATGIFLGFYWQP